MIPAVNGAFLITRLLGASPLLWRGAVLCLLAFGALPSAARESPPISLDEIRWKRFQPASEVYIDTTLQFTPAADVTPNVDVTKDKLALWLNVESSTFKVQGRDGLEPETRNPEPVSLTNLCVYASWADLTTGPAKRKGGRVIGARRAGA